MARALALDEDLAEAVALAHDLGHTPFGHAGEGALMECMRDHGGFDHNAQALRVVTKLERRYARYDGLDLTWETLEGLVKHNGPLSGRIDSYILQFDAAFPLELSLFAGAEAQAAAVADDIAYNAHDIDDGLRAGLFELDDISRVGFINELLEEIASLYPGLERQRVIHELTRRVITRFVEDAIDELHARLERAAPGSAAEIRAAGAPLVGLSPAMAGAEREVKAFLFRRMYRHAKVMGVWEQAREAISFLFSAFMADLGLMPREWAELAAAGAADARARVVADYIAGMTDRYALGEYRRLSGRAVEM